MTYSVAGFVEKNTDLLDKDLSCVMFQAEHPFLRTLFPEGESGLEKVMLGAMPSAQPMQVGKSICKY